MGSREGLEVFRKQGIKFFAGSTEYDLFNPDHELFLGISAVIGQFQARNQSSKSLRNRIARAKRGIPTGGKLPFGRKWNKKKERWDVDAKKKAVIEDCAKRYLAGEQIPELAEEYEMNASNLHKVLTKVSGPKWRLEFKSKALNIHEVVEMEIPPLLDEKTIAAIRERAAANRTYLHGHIKYQYLFARMISCAHCGYAMSGQTNRSGLQYYRHEHIKQDRPCTDPEKKAWIPAAELEDIVMRHLFETFGNPSAVKKAIEDATPNSEKIQEAVRRLQLITNELAKVKSGVQRILGLVAKGTISDEDTTDKLQQLKQRERKLDTERARLDNELAHLPSRKSIQRVSKQVVGRFRNYTKARAVAKARHANAAFDEMTYEEKRELCQAAFSGTTAEGKRMGVWVTWSEDGNKWRYHIDGHLIDASGPVNKDGFVFGAALDQKALVTESALHSPGTALPVRRSSRPGTPPCG